MITKREFIINELMVEHFAEWETNSICLEETEDTGKSVLMLRLSSGGNLSIKNVDKKKTQIPFFKDIKTKSMFKHVDHIVFEELEDDNWKMHLIEMKSSVGYDKWVEIKGKFRASYLLARAIAAILEMNIVETCMYTTYEQVHFSLPETMPVARRLPLGEKFIKPQDEWEGSNFGLNFGIRINFTHKPIQMERNNQGILQGNYICNT